MSDIILPHSPYLELIIGPVSSGKTPRLLNIWRNCMVCSIPVIAIKYEMDTFNNANISINTTSKLVAGNNESVPCIGWGSLMDIINTHHEQIHNAHVVLIDGGHLFLDLYDGVRELLNKNKRIYVCGLNCDFRREKIGHILDIIPLSNKITKVTGLCSICKNGTPADFTHRTIMKWPYVNQTTDEYTSVCGECYAREYKLPYNSPFTTHLSVVLGPMFSGKTSILVEEYNKCMCCNISVVALNHSLDKRKINSDATIVSTHSNLNIPGVCGNTIRDILIGNKDYIANSTVVLINEGQLFPDLHSGVQSLLTQGKKVVVCGLDGDYKREKFGQILDVIPFCNSVVKLTSMCTICKDGTPASFTHRTTSESSQVVIGGVDSYIPVCATCYRTCTSTDNDDCSHSDIHNI